MFVFWVSYRHENLVPKAAGPKKTGAFLLSWAFLCLLGVATGVWAQADPEALRAELTDAEGTDRLEILNRLSHAIAAQTPTEALAISDEAMSLAQQLGERRGEADALNNRGIARYYLAEYNEARESYESSLLISERLDYKIGIANSLNNLGIIHWIWGEYDTTIDYYLRALEIRRALGDEQGIAKAFNNLGSVSYASKDHDKALEYYVESLAIYRRLGDQSLIASSLNNIGLVHFELEDYKDAENYFSRGLSISESINDLSNQAYSLTHLGRVADKTGLPESALDHYRRALALRVATDDRRGVAVCEHNIGAALYQLGDFEVSLEHLMTSLSIAEEINLKMTVRDNHLALSQSFAENGDYRQALDHHRLFKEINDEIFNNESASRIAELEARYKLVEKDSEIERLQQQQERQRLVRNVMFAGSVALFLIIVLLYNRYRLKIRANRVIQERNSALEKARIEQDRAHRVELSHVGRVATMGELTAAIAHELKQPLTAILTNARVGQRLLAIDPPDLAEVVDALDDVVTGTERSQELLTRLRDLIRRGEITREELDLNETIRGIESIAYAESRLAGVTLEFDLGEDLPPVIGDRIQLQQVLINLVQNGVAAMNDRELKPRLMTVSSAVEAGSRVVVAVRDHGPPVDDETVRKMFDPFFSTKSDGLGMGLSICQTIIEAHRGQLWAEHNPKGGLTVKFALPVEEVGP